MKKKLLFLLGLFITLNSISQNIERITVEGKIVVDTDDKEGVTVYNSSSNTGTITDEEGAFSIAVTVNDVVEFGALQFKDFSITITDEIIKSKQLTVILVEEVNKLDEIVILPFGLTGSLNADLESVRTYNVSLDDVYFGLDHITDFEFSADYNTKAENLAFNQYNRRVDNMLNLVNLAGFIVSQVVNINDQQNANNIEKSPFKKALDTYSINYIHVNFNIPLDQIEVFADYVENQGIDKSLLEKDKELLFLERLSVLSKSFLKANRE